LVERESYRVVLFCGENKSIIRVEIVLFAAKLNFLMEHRVKCSNETLSRTTCGSCPFILKLSLTGKFFSFFGRTHHTLTVSPVLSPNNLIWDVDK
jgi:hypothetical protein